MSIPLYDVSIVGLFSRNGIFLEPLSGHPDEKPWVLLTFGDYNHLVYHILITDGKVYHQVIRCVQDDGSYLKDVLKFKIFKWNFKVRDEAKDIISNKIDLWYAAEFA